MRELLLALLLANLGYLAWSQWLAPDHATAGVGSTVAGGARGAVPTIRLVGDAEPRGAAAPASGQAAALPAAGESTASGASSAPATGPAGDAGVTDAPAMAPGPGAAAPAAAGGTAPPAAANAPVAKPAPANKCVALGAFANLEEVAQLTQLLKAAGREPRQRPADGLVPDGFVVMVGGLASAAEQESVQRRLRRGGLDDAIALPQAADRYAVSVGTFAERRRAERRAAVVTKMGLKPSVDVHQRAGTVYWIDVDVAANATDVAGSIRAALGSGAPASDWQAVPCPSAPAVR